MQNATDVLACYDKRIQQPDNVVGQLTEKRRQRVQDIFRNQRCGRFDVMTEIPLWGEISHVFFSDLLESNDILTILSTNARHSNVDQCEKLQVGAMMK